MNAQFKAQVEDMANAWMRFQTQWWDSLFAVGKGNGQGWEQIYMRPLQAGEDTVNCVLQQQSDYIRIVVKSIRPGNGAPRIACEWYDQSESAAQHWIGAQRHAWTTWFAAIRKVDPFRMRGQPRTDTVDQASGVLDAWNQATYKTLQAQAALMSGLITTGANAAHSSVWATSGNGASGATSSSKETTAAKAASPASRRSAA